MAKFIGTVKPISVKLMPASGKSIEERCRLTMLKNIRGQLARLKNPKAKGRRWFKTISDRVVFIPRYANESLATHLSRGKANAFPIMKTPLKTLKALQSDVAGGELDTVLVEIARNRGRAIAGKRRRKAGRAKT